MKYPVISEDSQAQQAYVLMRKKGQSHSIAEMLALQVCPGLQTDTRFLHGKPGNGFYSHQLQRWVGSRADVKKACIDQGLACEGSVSVPRPPTDRPNPLDLPYRVADELVGEYVQDVLDDHPTALMDDPELPSKVRKRLEGDTP